METVVRNNRPDTQGQVTFDDGITLSWQELARIENRTKYRCLPFLTKIHLTDFSACRHIRNIILPSSITSMDNSSFFYLQSLTEVTVPNAPIADRAFSHCNNLKVCNLGDGVTKIGDYAFCACSSLQSIHLSENTTLIGEHAFFGCSQLKTITIPSKVETIGECVFSNCNALTEINYSGTITQWESIEKQSEWFPPKLQTVHCTDGEAKVDTTVKREYKPYVPRKYCKDCARCYSTIPRRILESRDYETCDYFCDFKKKQVREFTRVCEDYLPTDGMHKERVNVQLGIEDYAVCKSETPYGLSKQVRNGIEKGYVPYGETNIFQDSKFYHGGLNVLPSPIFHCHQTLVKYKYEERIVWRHNNGSNPR